MKKVFVTTSWDDGHRLDLPLARLLKKYGLRGTFYISPNDHEIADHDRLCTEGIRELARDPNFEIGAHTLTHRWLTDLSDREAREEIVGSKRYLEDLIGAPVTSFCYPAGKYRAAHECMVREAGFQCARTVRRFARQSGENRYAEPTSIHAYDHWLDVWGLARFVRGNPFAFMRLYHRWDLQAMALFDRIREEGGVFHLWGHSHEVDRNGDLERLERVCRHIGGHADVTYVTNGELCGTSVS